MIMACFFIRVFLKSTLNTTLQYSSVIIPVILQYSMLRICLSLNVLLD
ncbi:hypothetical protein B4U79_13548 [Dinothrombium tinctorium]|uniref:Uncharacterized protein n=1 Tax=Dinothrombium tinctorium TaxID=1965070 RepID=A0A3S3NTJ8_9ACAR|nr:hypothetical protein B4U79_13548 [Dinothrombium tinctorium]